MVESWQLSLPDEYFVCVCVRVYVRVCMGVCGCMCVDVITSCINVLQEIKTTFYLVSLCTFSSVHV